MTIIKASKFCFKYSFIIGTLFLLALIITHHVSILTYGYFYLCVAMGINLIFLIILMAMFTYNSQNRIEIIKSIGLLLINIPIAILYFLMALYILDP